MAVLRTALLLLAILLLSARLFTGIVYEYDDPTTYLVLKHHPSLTILQQNAANTPLHQRFSVIDGGENELPYQAIYITLMGSAFYVAIACAGAALLLRRRKI